MKQDLPGGTQFLTTGRRPDDAALQLSIIVPTFNEAGNIVELRDRIEAALPGIDWELIFVDDDSPDGTSTTAARAGAAGPARALPAAHRPARAGIGLRRRHAGRLGADRCRHRRRPAARRDAPVGDAGPAARPRGRCRGRQPLRAKRQRRGLGCIARVDEPLRDPARPPGAASRTARPDERLLHDAPRRAAALRSRRRVGRGLQDPARPVRDFAHAAALSRSAVHLPQRASPARASSTPTSPGNTSSCCSTASSAGRCRSVSSPSR